MPTILCHRGRTVTADDLETIRALLMAHPEASRRAFSQRLCEHWDWRQANGALRDMVCRSLRLMAVLQREGRNSGAAASGNGSHYGGGPCGH